MSIFKKKLSESEWVFVLKDCIKQKMITPRLESLKKNYSLTKSRDFYLYFLEISNKMFERINKDFENKFNLAFSRGDEVTMIYEFKKWIHSTLKEFFYKEFNVLDNQEKNNITEIVAKNQKKFIDELKTYVKKNSESMINFLYECDIFLHNMKKYEQL